MSEQSPEHNQAQASGQTDKKPMAEIMAQAEAQNADVHQIQATGDRVAEVEKTDIEIYMYAVRELNYCGLEKTDENAEYATKELSAHQAKRQAQDLNYVLGNDPEESSEFLQDLVLQAMKEKSTTSSESVETTERAMAIKAAYIGDWQRFEQPEALDDLICDRLCQYEAENRAVQPDYDLTTDRNRRRAERKVRQWAEELAETQTIETKTDGVQGRTDVAEDRTDVAEDRTETAFDEEQEEENFAALQAELKESPDWQNLSTVAKLQRLLNEPRVPEEYKTRLTGLLSIHTIANQNETDGAIVSARFEQIDVFNPPTAKSFARAFIFDSPNNSTGVSAATQEAIATDLGITRHSVPLPKDADDLQESLRNGRGTERETEIRRVEEPPGSGNFVEQEVVVSERTLPFIEADPMLISVNPLVEAFPITPGSTTHQVVGAVTGADPIRFTVDIPKNGAFPTSDIHYLFNKGMMTANQHNYGLRGSLEYLRTGVDGTLPTSTNPKRGAIGERDIMQKQFEVFHGLNFPLTGRFATQSELGSARPEMRWLTIDGDFGVANQMDPAKNVALMKAVFGSSQEEIMGNLTRAAGVINTGGAETPSIQNLYQALHPEDAAAGYPQLHAIVGDDLFAEMNMPDQKS